MTPVAGLLLNPYALGKGPLGLVSKCAKTLGMGSLLSGKWCPGSILDYEHLQGYWDQFLLEDFVANYTKTEAALPNLISVNAFGADGTLEIDAGGKRCKFSACYTVVGRGDGTPD